MVADGSSSGIGRRKSDRARAGFRKAEMYHKDEDGQDYEFEVVYYPPGTRRPGTLKPE
jgi:hypothetical protein